MSPESWALSCCADLPGDQALYAVSVRRLIALHSGLPLPLVTLACGSPYASLQPFRRSLAVPPLPSANTFVNVLNTLTGFMYRGLPPHKFTPMPGVHLSVQVTARAEAFSADLCKLKLNTFFDVDGSPGCS